MIGALIPIIISWCSPSGSLQQRCEKLNTMLQQNMIEANNQTNEQWGEWWKFYQDDAFYSSKDEACYEWKIQWMELRKSYTISKIIFSWTDYDYQMTWEQKNIPNELFDEDCIEDENYLVNNIYPDLTGAGLEQVKRNNLCAYAEKGILDKYQQKIDELQGK